jgi:hypothetical protein
MAKHLLKRCGMHLFVADGEDVADHLTARTFGGRLSARTFLENRFGKDAAHQLLYELVKLEDVTPLEELRYDGPLVISDPLEAVKYCAERHEEYCAKVEAWLLRSIGLEQPSRPGARAHMVSPSWAGQYRSREHECVYPVAYAMINADYAEKAIAHEVVHGYQHQFTGHGTGHGGDFYALMKHAAGVPVSKHTHDYDVGHARDLAEYLHPRWMELREAGKLAGLPMPVAHEKLPRDDKPEEGDVE